MPSTRRQQQQQRQLTRRVLDREYRDGSCVFNALLFGVCGVSGNGAFQLQNRPNLTHQHLMSYIRAKMNGDDRAFANAVKALRFTRPAESGSDSDEITELCGDRDVASVVTEMQNTHVADGYNTSGFSALLVATCVCFNVSIVHRFLGNTLKFEMPNPKRVVHLSSSDSHMMWIKNDDM